MNGLRLVSLFGQVHRWSAVGTAAAVVLGHVVVTDSRDGGIACGTVGAIGKGKDDFVSRRDMFDPCSNLFDDAGAYISPIDEGKENLRVRELEGICRGTFRASVPRCRCGIFRWHGSQQEHPGPVTRNQATLSKSQMARSGP